MFLTLNYQQPKERFNFLTTEITEKLLSVNQITEIIIGCAIKVHSALGPGLLESAYQQCLFYELKKSGLKVEKEKALPVIYKRSNWNVVIGWIYLLKIGLLWNLKQ